MIHIESWFGPAQRFELFTGKRAATFVFMSGSDTSYPRVQKINKTLSFVFMEKHN